MNNLTVELDAEMGILTVRQSPTIIWLRDRHGILDFYDEIANAVNGFEYCGLQAGDVFIIVDKREDGDYELSFNAPDMETCINVTPESLRAAHKQLQADLVEAGWLDD